VGLGARRQLHPGMTAAVIDRNPGRREIRIGECAHGNTHGFRIAVFRVKQRGPANGTEPEDEPGTLVTNARVLSCLTIDLVRRRKSGKRCEDTAGSALARKAIADADTSGLAFDFNS